MINVSKLLLVCFLSFNTFANAQANDHTPCWCDSLNHSITKTKYMLIERYGMESLNASSIYSTSGNRNMLTKRLFRAITQKKKFHIGIFGGSMSLPIYNGNSWSHNVSRWMNSILSCQDCLKHDRFYNLTSSGCKYEIVPHNFFNDCLEKESSFGEKASTFCFDNSEFVNDSDIHNHSYLAYRDLSSTCYDGKHCNIFTGSGKYSTLALLGKGDSSTASNMWNVQNLVNDKNPFDMAFWDFGVNDFGNANFHVGFPHGFFDQLLVHNKHLAAIGVVYWQDSLKLMHENCESNIAGNTSVDVFSVLLPSFDYPILKHTFQPEGRFRDLSLVTMSLPHFCASAKCQIHDILHQSSKHPTANGISIFSDLIIWQLLRPFESILQTHCTAHAHASARTHSQPHHKTTHHTIDDSNTDTRLASVSHFQHWSTDAHLPASQLTFRNYDSFSEVFVNRLKSNTSVLRWPIAASLTLQTPILKKPPSIEKVSMLCAPSYQRDGRNTFILRDTNTSNAIPLAMTNWVELDIISLIRSNCAGWNRAYNPGKPFRFDDRYHFLPTSYRQCPSGSGPFMDTCEAPKWSESAGDVV